MPRVVTPSIVAPELAAAEVLTPDDGRPPISLLFAVPGSGYISPTDERMFHHGYVGHTAARGWASWIRNGVREVVSIQGGGSRADPTVYEAALSGAQHAYADLGAVDRDSDYVAEAVAAAARTLGAGATALSGGRVRVQGATSFLTGNALTRDDISGQRIGCFRVYPDASQLSAAANTGTAGRRIVPGFAGRVIAIGTHGNGGYQPILAVGIGGTFAAPGTITNVRSGQLAAGLSSHLAGIVPLDNPLPFTNTDALWMYDRSDGVGTRSYRNHGGTPTGQFQFSLNQASTVDTTNPDAIAPTAFGSSYTPVRSLTFNIYDTLFLVVERAPYQGCMILHPQWFGSHRAATGNSPTALVPAGGSDWFRMRAPQLPRIRATRVRIACSTIDANERFCWAMYEADSSTPMGTGHDLLGEGFVQPASANAYAEGDFDDPIEIGTDALGANAFIAIGNCAGTISPDGAPVTTQLLFDVPGTSNRYLLAVPESTDPEVYNDFIVGPDLRPTSVAVCGAQCLVTNASGGDMPGDTSVPVWPAEFDPDASDQNLGSVARCAFVLESSEAACAEVA
jgi:hypothetical protein